MFPIALDISNLKSQLTLFLLSFLRLLNRESTGHLCLPFPTTAQWSHKFDSINLRKTYGSLPFRIFIDYRPLFSAQYDCGAYFTSVWGNNIVVSYILVYSTDEYKKAYGNLTKVSLERWYTAFE